MDSVDAMPMEGMGKYKPRKGSRASLDDSAASLAEGSSSTAPLPFSAIKEDQEAEAEREQIDQPKTITRREEKGSKGIFSFMDNIPPRLKLFVQFLLHAFSLGLAISAFFVWTSPSIQYADLVENWEGVPITDIKLIAAGSSCPADFILEESSFFGVDNVCDCGPNNIKLLPCTVVDTSAGCKSVRNLDSFDLPLWRNYGICIQRHINGTAVNAANRRGNCNKPGWTTCTTGADPICVPENTPCPLTKFSVVYGGPSLCPAGTTATLAIPSSSEPRYLCTSREGSYPLVDLGISVGGRCLQSSSFNPYSQQNPHQGTSSLSVDVSTPPFPCGDSDLDTRYNDIEMRLMGSLFHDNLGTFSSLGVDSSDISYWTQLTYPVFYKFQVRAEIFFEKDCAYTRDQAIEAERELELVSHAQTGLVLVSIISSILVDFPWIVWSCTVGIKKYRQKTVAFLVKAIFTILSKVLSAALIAVTFYSIWAIRIVIDGLAQSHCGDKPTNDLFNHYNSEMQTTLWMDIIVFVWNIVTIILQIRSMIVLPTGKQNPQKTFASKPTEIELHEPRRTNFQGGDDDSGRDRFASRFTYSKGEIPSLDQLGSHRSFEPVSSVDDLSQAASRKSTQSFQM